MNHEEALNLILANHCGGMGETDKKLYGQYYMEYYDIPAEEMEKDIQVFEMDLHCATAVVVAELISTIDTIQYRIVSVKIK